MPPLNILMRPDMVTSLESGIYHIAFRHLFAVFSQQHLPQYLMKSEGNQYFHISPGAVIIWSKDSGILKGVKYELKNFFLLQILGEISSNFKKIKMELEIHNWYKGD